MNARSVPIWMVLLVAILAAACLGVSGTLAFAQHEGVGVDTVWERKKEMIRRHSPEAADLMGATQSIRRSISRTRSVSLSASDSLINRSSVVARPRLASINESLRRNAS
jgi:hypothetical protein